MVCEGVEGTCEGVGVEGTCEGVGASGGALIPLHPSRVAYNSTVQGVMLSYDGAGGVFVAWAPLIPHPPEGAVAFYEVQYGSSSYDEAVTVYPPSNSVHLIGVTDIYKVSLVLPRPLLHPLPTTPRLG